jgi:alkylation response protein AidB-like acyl-CoA dehydrogenase
MNFDFSDDQKFLKNEARKFLDANASAAKVRKVLDDDKVAYDAALWKAVAGQGWLGAAIPEEHGGLGLGHLELCVIAEELGRAVAPIPFASTVYFLAEAVMLAGTDDQKAALLPKIAAGEVIGCVATSEGPGVLQASALQASVSGGKLSGTKLPVTDGDIATHALVHGQGERSGRPVPGGPVVRRQLARRCRPSIPPAMRQSSPSPASPSSASARRARASRCWNRSSTAPPCCWASNSWAAPTAAWRWPRPTRMERYAFGRVIASYQAIKHKLADIYVKNEVARSNAYYGAWALNTNAPELPVAASRGADRGL